jgi:hypothetical protein
MVRVAWKPSRPISDERARSMHAIENLGRLIAKSLTCLRLLLYSFWLME